MSVGDSKDNRRHHRVGHKLKAESEGRSVTADETNIIQRSPDHDVEDHRHRSNNRNIRHGVDEEHQTKIKLKLKQADHEYKGKKTMEAEERRQDDAGRTSSRIKEDEHISANNSRHGEHVDDKGRHHDESSKQHQDDDNYVRVHQLKEAQLEPKKHGISSKLNVGDEQKKIHHNEPQHAGTHVGDKSEVVEEGEDDDNVNIEKHQEEEAEPEKNVSLKKIATPDDDTPIDYAPVRDHSNDNNNNKLLLKTTDMISPPAATSSRMLKSSSDEAIFKEERHDAPYFYYQNQTSSHNPQHYFALHSHPSNNLHENGSLYTNYGTTLTFIAFLHILYIYQWNARRSRQDVCTSYDQLVEKKQFYRGLVAIVSHPPADGGERDSNSLHNGESLMNDGEGGPIQRTGFFGRIFSFMLLNRAIVQRIRPIYQRIKQRILHPLMYGSLSGLPLLVFASHVLWQCRALEELYDDQDGQLILGVVEKDVNATQFTGIGTAATKLQTAEDAYRVSNQLSMNDSGGYTYFRVLVALAFTTILLELSLSRSILKRMDRYVDFEGYRTTPRQLLSQRAMCSIASLTTALLGVYDTHFPYTPPPVLPFVRVSVLSSSGFSMIFSIAILAVLAHRIHPVTSIISGLLSGSLWTLGLTSFLGTRYWGNAMLFSLGLAMLLSLKAQPTYSKYLEMLVPCIDYVAWDIEGDIPDGRTQSLRRNSRRLSRSIHDEDNNDLEMGSHYNTQNGGHSNHHERFPLLSSESSSMSGGSSTAIRGRVPLINTMESDLDGAEDLVNSNEEVVPAASSQRFGASLSRRTGGAGTQ